MSLHADSALAAWLLPRSIPLSVVIEGTTPAGVALLFLLLAGAAFYLLLIPYLESKTPLEGVPTAPGCNWLLGHSIKTHRPEAFPEGYLSVYREHADVHGRTGFWLVNSRCLSLMNIQDARHVLKKESYRNQVPIISHYIGKVIGSRNLLFLNGREWKTHRDAVTRTFVHSFLRQSQEDVWQVAQDLIATLQDRIASNPKQIFELDMLPVMKMVTSDVIGKAAFSTNFNCCKSLEYSTIVGAFNYMMTDTGERALQPLSPLNYFYFLPTEKNRLLDEQVNILRGFIQKLLEEARIKMKQLNNNLSPKNEDGNARTKISLVDRLVVAHDNGDSPGGIKGSYIADQVLIDVVSTLLIASYDTTSTTLAFALYILANHPDIQEKCLEEVIYCPGCYAVIQETLRLYPPAALTGRVVTKPITLSDGFVVPKGVRVAIPIFGIHRAEQYFPRALECLPTRWCERQHSKDGNLWVERQYQAEVEQSAKQQQSSDDSSSPAGNPDAFLPFSAGARNCPGAKFAQQEAVIVLANLVQHFRFLPVPGYKLKLNLYGPLPAPVGGMPLRMETR